MSHQGWHRWRVECKVSAEGLRSQLRAVQQLLVKSFHFSRSSLQVPGTKQKPAAFPCLKLLPYYSPVCVCVLAVPVQPILDHFHDEAFLRAVVTVLLHRLFAQELLVLLVPALFLLQFLQQLSTCLLQHNSSTHAHIHTENRRELCEFIKLILRISIKKHR